MAMAPQVSKELTPLGLSLMDGGGVFSVWSETATEVSLNILDAENPSLISQSISLERSEDGIWSAGSDLFHRGMKYVLRAQGPQGPRHAFNPERNLLDPYARGLVRLSPKDYYCVAVESEFDWQGVSAPNTTLSETIIYEAHVRGLSRINPSIPEEIRGSYAALGHPATIEYLQKIGITAIELLPIQAFISEPRLVNLGLINYWGYNTINFFTPHLRYAAETTRAKGPEAIIQELKTAIRELHRAGIEVLMDVVYNHTAEGGHKGLTYSYRGLDNSSYYRQDDNGNYHDTTGCGNSLDFSRPMVQRMVLDSLKHWIKEFKIDGFRFDLATTLARDEKNQFNPNHDLLTAMQADPVISKSKLIVEPWDIGLGGWQTGNFPPGFAEWNDRYRDSVRRFWLSDIAHYRGTGSHQNGVAELASRLAGSQDVIRDGAGPIEGVNFINAHDGFTLNDLVSYNVKHNSANGEGNRDGANNNYSFNHGTEGPTPSPTINSVRRKAMRNLLGTLMFSAGIPMIAAGDERAKTQGGNNNAYCQDNVITWQTWDPQSHESDLEETFAHLAKLRKQFPGLRPIGFANSTEPTKDSDLMLWFNEHGHEMTEDDWNNPERRVLQRYSEHLAEDGSIEALLLVINGAETLKPVNLAMPEKAKSLELLWDSSLELPPRHSVIHNPGSAVKLVETSMQLFAVKA